MALIKSMIIAEFMISQNDLKSLGEILKNRRKEMNVSLKEAENATSIRTSYLHSIEEGDVSKLISPVYAQGFVKQYAIYLGLDGDKIIKDHPHIFAKSENQEFSYGIGTLEMRGNPGSGVKWFPNTMWVLASIVMILGAWYLSRYFGLI